MTIMTVGWIGMMSSLLTHKNGGILMRTELEIILIQTMIMMGGQTSMIRFHMTQMSGWILIMMELVITLI